MKKRLGYEALKANGERPGGRGDWANAGRVVDDLLAAHPGPKAPGPPRTVGGCSPCRKHFVCSPEPPEAVSFADQAIAVLKQFPVYADQLPEAQNRRKVILEKKGVDATNN